MNAPEPARPGRRVLAPLYAAGFVTAFGAHAVAANLGGYGTKHHTSLWELGLLLGVYDAAEVVLKPVFGSLSDRIGAKPVMLGGLFAFSLASAAFVVAGQAHWLGLARFGQGAAAAASSDAAGAMDDRCSGPPCHPPELRSAGSRPCRRHRGPVGRCRVSTGPRRPPPPRPARDWLSSP